MKRRTTLFPASLFGLGLLLARGRAFAAARLPNTAACLWSATGTWATLRSGTITTSTSSTTITGVGTLFLTELANGDQLFTAGGVRIGILATMLPQVVVEFLTTTPTVADFRNPPFAIQVGDAQKCFKTRASIGFPADTH